MLYDSRLPVVTFLSCERFESFGLSTNFIGKREAVRSSGRDWPELLSWLEGYLDGRLEDAWTADTVDIADATAEKSGYLAKRARPEGGSG